MTDRDKSADDDKILVTENDISTTGGGGASYPLTVKDSAAYKTSRPKGTDLEAIIEILEAAEECSLIVEHIEATGDAVDVTYRT